jgi:hypothetical protein
VEQEATFMSIITPTIRFVLNAVSACGLIDNQRDSATSRSNRVGQKDSPFVLVAGAADGRWGVFQRNFDMPQASFDGMQEACDYANEIAKTRLNSMVLIRKRRDPAANPETKSACDVIGK